MNVQSELVKSIYTGFVDQNGISLNEYQPKLLINDSKNGHKVLTSLISELNKCDEFLFSVAFVTNSGVASLINTLKDLEEKGVKGKIIASQYQNFTEPKALERLISLKNIEVRIVTENNFHAKGYIFKKSDTYTLIIGSSNLTQNALSYNKEWNIKVSSMNEGSILMDTLEEFEYTFKNADIVDEMWISQYQKIYDESKKLDYIKAEISGSDIIEFPEIDTPEIDRKENGVLYNTNFPNYMNNDFVNLVPDSFDTKGKTGQAPNHIERISIGRIMPNKMQVEALASIETLKKEGKNKALLISATGTGKTYLSAFDVKKSRPKHFLFVVHRENIARAAMHSYKKVLGQDISMGILTGNTKDFDADYLFCTVQTLSRDHILERFPADYFDYILIDEVHRSGADTYQKILNYFKPEFLLGMTATPERTDGFDIFKQFDYNIAYEIRLHRALEENMLCPFHYYGVTDISIDDNLLSDKNAFFVLTNEERVNKIIEKAEFYGADDGVVRGLIFCNSNQVSRELSKQFNLRGYKTVSLSGESSEIERENAIRRLETDKSDEKLDYIFTVDIFNEGVDIPRVNQIIMLRPTQSAIVFVQQLGRGLRKLFNKDYLTVIDFIGNYNNNFLVPIALYGDTSYKKDHIRKLISSNSSMIPGASTINFDKIAKEQIFKALDNANLQLKKDLVKDYDLLKYKIGRIPMMMDFIEHSSRDPELYADYSKSYFNFVLSREPDYKNLLNSYQIKLLELFSSEIANGKRIEEVILLKTLIEKGELSKADFLSLIQDKYKIDLSEEIIKSALTNLNFEFSTENHNKMLVSVSEKYGIKVANKSKDQFKLDELFLAQLDNVTFKLFLMDQLNYAIHTYDSLFKKDKYVNGFMLYSKYSRKDVFRILNWSSNPLAQNVGGYIISKDKSNCPIFVNYHKEESISSATKYEDHFVNNYVFAWMSKNKRKLTSPDVMAIKNYRSGLRIPLFIKKSNDEGLEFYYMGDIIPIDESFEQVTIKDDDGNDVSVVKVRFNMINPVEENIYKYITNG